MADIGLGRCFQSGIIRLVLSNREGRDATLLSSVKQSVVKSAQNLVSNSQKDPYGRAMSRYYWGCNGTMCRQAINLHVADMIQPDAEYQKTILKILAHTFSDNYYNRSYVTGLGLNPPLHPHDRRSIADGIDAPWPGYLVGGGHSATDWVDEQEDYERNEIAINWQAHGLSARCRSVIMYMDKTSLKKNGPVFLT